MRLLDDVEEVVEAALDEMAAFDRALDDVLPQYGPGFRAPKTAELPKWLYQKRQEFPPQPWVMPDGRAIVESIYLVALSFTEEGRDVLRKVRKLTEGA